MELKLKNIYCHGDNNVMVYISFEVVYGWEGENIRDIVRINFNGTKGEAYVTVKAEHPGIGAVIQKVVEVIAELDLRSGTLEHPPRAIIEALSHKLHMEYDHMTAEEALKAFNSP